MERRWKEWHNFWQWAEHGNRADQSKAAVPRSKRREGRQRRPADPALTATCRSSLAAPPPASSRWRPSWMTLLWKQIQYSDTVTEYVLLYHPDERKREEGVEWGWGQGITTITANEMENNKSTHTDTSKEKGKSTTNKWKTEEVKTTE